MFLTVSTYSTNPETKADFHVMCFLRSEKNMMTLYFSQNSAEQLTLDAIG